MTQAPLSSDDFAAMMAPLGPFETRPRLAVAVSGGADSLALTLLAHDWVRARGGEVQALTVDHGLRPESAVEARQVGDWLAARGIAHRILTWEGEKPAADLQAAARSARYDLLGAACRDAGILHLLLAHHREDQAETLLLRLGRGSGVDGLAAMAPVRHTRWGRLLRPLLGVSRLRLVSTLEAAGQDWIEDPSNRNPLFARVRLRHMAADLAAEGLTPQRLAATAGRMARARASLDRAVAEAAASWLDPHPAGFVRVGEAAFAALDDEIALRLLSRLVLAVGGGVHPPRLERLERLLPELRGGLAGARTLGGCRLVPSAHGLVVCREPARMAPPVAAAPGAEILWDGRVLARMSSTAPGGVWLGGLAAVSGRKRAASAVVGLPACVRPSLPAIFHQDGVFAVPVLGYNQSLAEDWLHGMALAPFHALTLSGF